MNEYALLDYYIKYLKTVRKVKDSTVKHYQEALKYISKYLVEKGKIQASIYEIRDLVELEIIKEYLYNDPDFVALDKRGHQMYSAGLNNYFKFASGVGLHNIKDEIKKFDMEVAIGKKAISKTESWKRSSIVKVQTLESSDYKCEIDFGHTTFTAKSTNKPYMEGHHIIPMNKQQQFNISLDVYANVICLCPVCHRLLHYGIEDEKKGVLKQIYINRMERLSSCGIRLNEREFFEMVGR